MVITGSGMVSFNHALHGRIPGLQNVRPGAWLANFITVTVEWLPTECRCFIKDAASGFCAPRKLKGHLAVPFFQFCNLVRATLCNFDLV